MIKDWEVMPFKEIKVDEITSKAELYQRIVRQCERNLPPESTAVAHLRKIVFDFKETMPIVQAMGNLMLKQSHWEQITSLLNFPADQSNVVLEEKDFTLGDLVKWRAAEKQDEIVHISVTATQECNL